MLLENLVKINTESVSPPSLSQVNLLIDKLPWQEHGRVMAYCESVELADGEILCEAETPFQHVYFPITAVISLVKILNDHQSLETEQIGNEGMLGSTLLLGVDISPQRSVVKRPGAALRVTPSELQKILRVCPSAAKILKHYLYLNILEVTQTAACSRFHDVAARLARTLLMIHDRSHSDHFNLTHQFLADMLGVQRGGVTIAAGRLQRQNIIHYSRGNISILDRKALEDASCECYNIVRDHYERLLP